MRDEDPIKSTLEIPLNGSKNYVVGWLSLTDALAEPTKNTILRTRVLSAVVAAVVRAKAKVFMHVKKEWADIRIMFICKGWIGSAGKNESTGQMSQLGRRAE
ncbi:hypothetical protein Tco_0364579 [Tanacetum coccineum]